MAEKRTSEPAGMAEGMSKLMEAGRHNMTAVNLAAAGAVAVGAAAVAYMWDAQRRNALFDATRQWTDQMSSFWQQRTSANSDSGAI
jgi:hypothetical protein